MWHGMGRNVRIHRFDQIAFNRVRHETVYQQPVSSPLVVGRKLFRWAEAINKAGRPRERRSRIIMSAYVPCAMSNASCAPAY